MIAIPALLSKGWPIIAGAGALALVWFAVDGLQDAAYERGELAERAKWEQAQAEAEQKARQQAQENQAETARRYAEQQKAINDAQQEIENARRDAASAAAAGQRLRAQIASLTASCRAPSDPGTAPGGPATDAAGDMLADVFSRVDEVAGTVARYADEARTAGLTCERSYDALTTANNPQ